MNSIAKLSFSTCYYIRKILLQEAEDIKWILAQKTGFCISSLDTLKDLLESVYLEDVLEQLLATLYPSSDINVKIEQIEKLCLSHQRLLAKNLSGAEELLEIQRQIYWVLGFKLITVKVEDLVTALNQISKYSSNYLGPTLTVNNWQSNRPDADWLANFQVDRAAKFTFSGNAMEEVKDFSQLRSLQDWVSAFINQNSKVIRDFANTIEQSKLGIVKEGLPLSQIGSYSSWLTVDAKPLHSWLN